MNRLFKIAYQPYKWLIVVPFVFLNTMILGSVCIIAGLLFGQGAAVNMIATLWAKLCCYIPPLRIRIQGREHILKNASYVAVSNHQSMADIPALHGFSGLNIKWVMKKELEKVPIFGAACTQLGCIYVDRSHHDAALRSIEAAKEKLKGNASVLFFAEGTRTRDGHLLEFKKGAFRFATQVGLPILPITIHDSMHRLPSDSMDLIPGAVHITIHPPIPVKPGDETHVNALMDKTRQIIASAL